MPIPTIPAGNKYMDATTYTGNGSSQSITNSGSMQPDFVWIKGRSTAYGHQLFDSIRGATTYLASNTTDAESTNAQTLTSFNSNGFSLGTNVGVNQSSATQIGWQWKAGGTAVSNTAGTITSQVSANTTSGFSVATYTGNGTGGATIGHGLGVAPSMIIIKQRSTASVNGNWAVYHQSLGNTGYLALNTTSAVSNDIGYWNNTSPTSSVFSVGTFEVTNRSTATYVAYCWTPIAGYSKFGSYTGNGSTDGPFVYLGFRPRYIMIKTSSAVNDWVVLDTSRNTYNAANSTLYPNLSNAEESPASSVTGIDILSNGFKIRDAKGFWNASGGTFIYAAFAENPFKYALAR